MNIGKLKGKLIREGLLEYKCYECGIFEWRYKKLILQLHHKNGNSIDNDIGNLCLLCPNCHSQTDNYAGRNNKSLTKNKSKIEWPDDQELQQMVWNKSIKDIAKELNIYSETLIKRCSDRKISRRPKGHWNRVYKFNRTKFVWPIKEDLEKLVWDKNLSSIAKSIGCSSATVSQKCRSLNIELPPNGYWCKGRPKSLKAKN